MVGNDQFLPLNQAERLAATGRNKTIKPYPTNQPKHQSWLVTESRNAHCHNLDRPTTVQAVTYT